ncbi:GAF domain-containing protein [Aurantivibrio plasticivorans]
MKNIFPNDPQEEGHPFQWNTLIDLVGFIADGAWETDRNGVLTRLEGDSLNTLWGPILDDYIGLPFDELSVQPLVVNDPEKSLIETLNSGGRSPWCDCVVTDKSGVPKYLRVAMSDIRNDADDCTGYRGLIIIVPSVTNAQQDRFREIADESPDCIFLSNTQNFKFEYVNNRVVELSGIPREQLLHMYGHQLTGRTFEDTIDIFAKTIEAGKKGYTEPIHFATSVDGKKRGWFEPSHRVMEMDGAQYIVTISREVTPLILAEKSLERAKRIYSALSATISTVMRAVDERTLFDGVCEALVDHGRLDSVSIMLENENQETLNTVAASGGFRDEVLSMSVSTSINQPGGLGLNALAYRSKKNCVSNEFLHDSRAKVWKEHAEKLDLRSGAAIPLIKNAKCIGTLFLSAHERRVFDKEVVSLLENVAENLVYGIETLAQRREKTKVEARVQHLATHDELTGLPNRGLFSELLDQAIASAKRKKLAFAVMFIDLDGFKRINDFLGHAAGDKLLQIVSARMKSALRESDVVARLGGDEFVILLNDAYDTQAIDIVANKILEVARQPVEVLGQECQVSASMGIARYPLNGKNKIDLMKNADAAMYLSKAKGKNTFEYFISSDQRF